MYYNSSSKTRGINNMKTAALIYGRNDDYKENERLIVHITSLLETFDEVLYLDWGSDEGKGSVINEIRDKIPQTGRLKHFIIPPSIISQCFKGIENLPPVIGCFCFNILLRRCDADWIVCTTNDIIAPNKTLFNNFLSKADKNTFYTLSRRDVEYEDLKNIGFNNWRQYRDILDKESKPRYFPAQVTPNDIWSIINCCGDFQLAHKNIWNTIKGFEENMIYACFLDTNIQKKATLNGFNLKAEYDVPLYHLSHTGMGNDGSSPSKQVYNDARIWVETFNKTLNDDNWGFGETEIEYETI